MIYNCDILELPKSIPSYKLIYADPPYNTGKEQRKSGYSYNDKFDDYEQFLFPRILEMRNLLDTNGSLLLHLDWHEVHYAKTWCDEIFGRDSFINEIIWAYDYGGRGKRNWPRKHDTILWYARGAEWIFNYDAVDNIPKNCAGLTYIAL